MKTIFVCCAFRGDTEAESHITGELNKYNGVRLKTDSWLLSTDAAPEAVWDSIHPAMRKRAYIFIAEMGTDVIVQQPQNITGWIKKYCG